LPTEQYLLAEILFLPTLRIVVWMLGAAVTHLALRLVGHPGGFDQLLNIGGLGYLVVMLFILVSDWLLIVIDRYDIVMVTHSLVLPWAMILTVIGLRQLLNVRRATA
jgi:hypothetical protein